jgi:hypothetical protein
MPRVELDKKSGKSAATLKVAARLEDEVLDPRDNLGRRDELDVLSGNDAWDNGDGPLEDEATVVRRGGCSSSECAVS